MGVILGGRIGYVLFYQLSEFLANPMYLFKINQGMACRFMGIFGCRHRNAIFARKYQKKHLECAGFYYSLRANRTAVWAYWQFYQWRIVGRVSDGGYNWLMLFPSGQ